MGINWTFLKKIGAGILQGLKIATNVLPTISQEIPATAGIIGKIQDGIDLIGGVIVSAEVMGQALNLPGTQKLTAAAPQVAQIILQSALLAGKKIADQAKFNAGCVKVADGFADILNSLSADEVKTVTP